MILKSLNRHTEVTPQWYNGHTWSETSRRRCPFGIPQGPVATCGNDYHGRAKSFRTVKGCLDRAILRTGINWVFRSKLCKSERTRSLWVLSDVYIGCLDAAISKGLYKAVCSRTCYVRTGRGGFFRTRYLSKTKAPIE
jgi:hypothetical protein